MLFALNFIHVLNLLIWRTTYVQHMHTAIYMHYVIGNNALILWILDSVICTCTAAGFATL